MAFGDIIQSKVSNALSVTLDATPTEGNLVVLCVCADNGPTVTGPSGYAEDLAAANGVLGLSVFSKVAGAAEGSELTISLGTTEVRTLIAVEIEGPWASSPADKTASFYESDIQATCTSGTTAATAQADEVALALFGAHDGDAISATDPTYTNSFVHIEDAAAGTGVGDAGLAVASKVLTATGTQESTIDWANTDSRGYGGIVTYMKESVGASTILPQMMQHLN